MNRNPGIRAGITATLILVSLLLLGAPRSENQQPSSRGAAAPLFEAVQLDLFAISGGQPNCWADFDNDGRPDLYVSSYIDKPVNEKDFLYHNEGNRFVDVTTDLFRKHGATHGLQWADYDKDGAIDLALANNNPDGRNALYRNLLPAAQARRSLEVVVLDGKGRYTRAGSEVRLYAAGTRKVVGGRIVDSGSGYTSQSQIPVHFGLSDVMRVDVEVTYFSSPRTMR